MAQIILNFAVPVFIASVFLTMAMPTLAGKDRSLQKVPATIRTRLNQNRDRRF
ncbi:hypothetical protein [Rhizobium bangladeshense]|uniref:hypothetical protein n=1 Tax=Rhizobium bangladeshense TaxID=1138189 RepID=UPI000AB61C4A|nr:hypothetical protein [Rhizobium bangladeshense]